MKFDRKAAGGGMEIIFRPENGRAYLEWRFHFRENEDPYTAGSPCTCPMDKESNQILVKITMTDESGNTVAECVQALEEEEPLETVLMQPCLWQGMGNPFLYHVTADLIQNGKYLDSLRRRLPLRVMETGKDGELLLNERPFTPKAVRYGLPDGFSAPMSQKLVMEDFQRLRKLGANCICGEGKEFREISGFPESFLGLCDRFGFLLFVPREEEASAERREAPGPEGAAGQTSYVCAWAPDVRLPYPGRLPLFRGRSDCLFMEEGGNPTRLYYQYRAKWSKEPFVYIVPESLKKLESGNYTVTCCSNCGKTALYSDGILFEFREEKGELVFWEVPAKGPCIRLSAEGDGVGTSFSVHKSLVGFRRDSPGSAMEGC